MKHYFFNSFASVRSIAALGVICMLLFTVASCKSEDEFDLSRLACDGGGRWWVILTPKPGATDCPSKNLRIKALAREHNVTFIKVSPEEIIPIDERRFRLEGGELNNCNLRRGRRAVRAFLATGLFELVRIHDGIVIWGS